MSNTCSPTHAPLAWTPTLFDAAPCATVDPSFARLEHVALADDAWVDHLPGWLTGAGAVFDDLVAHAGWQSHRRLMYGRFVDDPRLSTFDPEAIAPARLADPVIRRMGDLLTTRYGVELRTVGLNFYRDGRDSVAWHGDRIGRDLTFATIAIVSVGGRRPFRLRPKNGGPSIEFALGGGDLLVMGGTCQRTWDHAVPKVRWAPPRISITFRDGYL